MRIVRTVRAVCTECVNSVWIWWMVIGRVRVREVWVGWVRVWEKVRRDNGEWGWEKEEIRGRREEKKAKKWKLWGEGNLRELSQKDKKLNNEKKWGEKRSEDKRRYKSESKKYVMK